MINRIINITLKEDKSFNIKNFKLGNKYENEITKIKFEIPEIFNDLTKRYIVLQNPDETRQFALPLQSDNSFILTTITSKESGNWKLLLLLKETEFNGNITDETTENIVISDIIVGTISDNYIEDTEINPESDPNLNIFYEELEAQINYLSSDEFANLIYSKIGNGKDGATFIPSIDENGNLSWSNDKGLENPETINLKGPKGDPGNDGAPGEKGEKGDPGSDGSFEDLTDEQKESLRGPAGAPGEKGDPGLDGKSAYQVWVDLGNEGTEEDFINNLKGEKGDPGQNGTDGEKGDKGDPGSDGKSAYEVYLDGFNYKNLEYNDIVGGKTLRIKESRKGWTVLLACSNYSDLALKLIINDTEEYIEDVATGEVFSFDSNREVVVPSKFTFLNSVEYQVYPVEIDTLTYEIGDLLEIKETGEALSESQWIESLRGNDGEPGPAGADYTLTDTDKQEIAALVGSNFIISGEITRIEAVSEYPSTEEEGVLYILI